MVRSDFGLSIIHPSYHDITCCTLKSPIPKMNSSKFYEEYQKLKIVGQGSFGTATLYRRASDGMQVVVKEVFLLEMDTYERKTALNEVEILATLSHLNIIRYCGNFQKYGSLFIVMEYANGGNLQQLINAKRNKNDIFVERSVLNIISQISAAVAYMHDNKILHRDLKSANIFLNMSGIVQVGDFGISKMLKTKSQAHTVVGTPYYLSPEICEGSDYNDKSDVWAMGCILYELACLRKPFEAPTLPVLVQKIIHCEYNEIPDFYSEELSQLVGSILQRDLQLRPSAKLMHESLIPKIVKKRMSENLDFDATVNSSTSRLNGERSILYKIFDYGDEQKIICEELPHKVITSFSIGSNHQIVVTADYSVYAWGDNSFGQLGLNATVNEENATCIKSLQNAQIYNCATGKNFSLFVSKCMVYSCGDGKQGCLGHGDWNSLSQPKPIDWLKGENITEICCGDEHVVALSSEGKVYTWGSSKNGQLGQGHTQYRCNPLLLKLSTKIVRVFCGDNESVLLSTSGQVLVSGRNNHNKLGIYNKSVITLFVPIALNEKIKFVSVGTNHAAYLTIMGSVLVFGQFGKRKINQPQMLKLNHTNVAVGSDFTVTVDDHNVVWFWGSVKTLKQSKPIRSTTNGPSVNKMDTHDKYTYAFINSPQSILAFYSSQSNRKSGNVIYIKDIKVKASFLYVLAQTTAPPPIKQFSNTDLNYRNPESIGTTAVQKKSTNLPNVV